MTEKKSFYLRLLKSPARKTILLYLAQHGPCRFVDIKRDTGLTTGVIYHHLRSLSKFIVQDQNKFYSLNEEGKRLASYVSDTVDLKSALEGLPQVNDVLLESVPSVVNTISAIGLVPLNKVLSGSRALQVAVLIAALEFCFIILSRNPVGLAPTFNVMNNPLLSVTSTLIALYLFSRLFAAFVSGRTLLAMEAVNKQNPRNPLFSRLKNLFEPELLSSLSVGLAIIYVSSFIYSFDSVFSSALAIIFLIWGFTVIAAALSYFKGLEFIPALIFPFTAAIFGGLVNQASVTYASGGLEQLAVLGLMGTVSLFVSKWTDNAMKNTVGGQAKSSTN
jgi:DNA-binding HxlR family transcriptional regulator